MNKIMLCLLSGLILLSCSETQQEEPFQYDKSESSLDYARKFSLTKSDQLVVLEPWPGATEPISYSLDNIPERVVVTSTTHLPFLELLSVEHTLIGFAGTQYISSQKINKRVSDGHVAEVGVDGQLNLELLINTNPDLVIVFDMGSESSQLDKIVEAGIPVIYNSDFLESSALGRAEWIKFFGAIYDKQQMADSIFTEIEFTYQSLRKLAANRETRPTLFTGVMYGDAWFLPGGQNWASQFYTDAGAEYLWQSDSSSGWLELGFESVFEKAHQADFWIGIATFNTLEELAAQDQRYTRFQSFQNGGIYSYNKKIGPKGGFDFFESGYARPDIVLADLIRIIHPDLLPDYDPYYFKQIQ
jgi:iron complex transport system substrate-binding protein